MVMWRPPTPAAARRGSQWNHQAGVPDWRTATRLAWRLERRGRRACAYDAVTFDALHLPTALVTGPAEPRWESESAWQRERQTAAHCQTCGAPISWHAARYRGTTRCRSCAAKSRANDNLTPQHQRAAAEAKRDRERENARLADLAREHGLA